MKAYDFNDPLKSHKIYNSLSRRLLVLLVDKYKVPRMIRDNAMTSHARLIMSAIPRCLSVD